MCRAPLALLLAAPSCSSEPDRARDAAPLSSGKGEALDVVPQRARGASACRVGKSDDRHMAGARVDEWDEEAASAGWGVVEKLPLPPRYQPYRYSLDYPVSWSVRSYVSCPDRESQISIFVPGERLLPEEGRRFQGELAKAPHALAQDDLCEVFAVVEDKAVPERFQLASARTESIGGRTVLLVEGVPVDERERSPERSLVAYVPADEAGTDVHQVSIRAPADTFEARRTAFLAAFANVHWSNPPREHAPAKGEPTSADPDIEDLLRSIRGAVPARTADPSRRPRLGCPPRERAP